MLKAQTRGRNEYKAKSFSCEKASVPCRPKVHSDLQLQTRTRPLGLRGIHGSYRGRLSKIETLGGMRILQRGIENSDGEEGSGELNNA